MSAHSKKEPTFSDSFRLQLEALNFNEMRAAIGIFLQSYHGGHELWDLITGLRGPDSPSETPDMSSSDAAVAYDGRRKRKYKSTEVIRHNAFYGIVGGSARSHKGNSIKLPPAKEWDHFDKHMARAAKAIGLGVETE